MKKLIRITSLILAVLLCCLTFAGCDALDEMKAAQGYITEGDNMLYDGNEYIPLPMSDVLKCPEFDPWLAMDMYVNITETDVPVLLSNIFFEYDGYVTKDKSILSLSDYDYNDIYYCRKDVYDDMIKRLNSDFTAEKYAYQYYDYDNDFTSTTYTLTEEQMAAVDDVLATVEPEQDVYNNNESYCVLYKCSEDMLFSESYVHITYMNGNYSIVENPEYEVYTVYRVPKELNGIFAEIMAEQMISDGVYFAEEEIII